MLLKDLEQIGMTFFPEPEKPVKATKRKSIVFGELAYGEMRIPVQAVLRKRRSKVLYVAGPTAQLAAINNNTLHSIYSEAMDQNQNGLRTTVVNRWLKRIAYIYAAILGVCSVILLLYLF